MKKLWCDLKTDEERLEFIRNGRAVETGIIAKAMVPDLISVFEDLLQQRQEAGQNRTKVYVLILWFYEGDSNLVDAFEGVFPTIEKAIDAKRNIDNQNREIVSSIEAEKRKYRSGGGYDSPSYFEIRECNV